jgi:hypothetical protein
VIADYEVIARRRVQREAAAVQVEARFQEYVAGKTTVDFLLTAQQQWASALSQEYQAITNYNFDLAAFQFAKGTLLAHDSITIAEGPLPMCVQVRAVENERQRAQALVCRERAAVVPVKDGCCLPDMPALTPPSLPALMMDQKDQDRVSSEPTPLPRGPVNVLVSEAKGLSAPAAATPSEAANTPAEPAFHAAPSPPPPMSMPTAPGPLPMPSGGPAISPEQR